MWLLFLYNGRGTFLDSLRQRFPFDGRLLLLSNGGGRIIFHNLGEDERLFGVAGCLLGIATKAVIVQPDRLTQRSASLQRHNHSCRFVSFFPIDSSTASGDQTQKQTP